MKTPIAHAALLAGAALFFGSTVSGCGSPQEEPGVPSAGPATDVSGIAATYRNWDFSTCASADRCAESFREKAGQKPNLNPKASMKNPDPAWIPEWESLPSGDPGARYVYEALVLAATNRTWAKRCDEAYTAYGKKLDAKLAQVRELVAKESRDPNPYDRLAALLALKPKRDPETSGEFVEGSDVVRYEIEASIFDAFEATNRTFLYAVKGYAPSDSVLASTHKREPRAYERDSYCLDASRGLIADVPKLPTLSPGTDEVRSMVTPVLTAERIREVEKRRQDLVEVTKAKFAKVTGSTPSLPPGVREMSEGRVQRFERDGKGATVVLLLLAERTDASGKIQKIDETITASFSDWPSGLVLELGDAISFYGIEQKLKDTIIKSSPILEHLSRETTVLAKHLSKATNKGKSLVYFTAPR